MFFNNLPISVNILYMVNIMETEDISKELAKNLKKLKNNNIKIESDTEFEKILKQLKKESANSFTTSNETEESTITESVILESEINDSESEVTITPINGPSKISTIIPNTELINKKYIASSMAENKLLSTRTAASSMNTASSCSKSSTSKIYKLHII